jgi:hypothetical protein
MIHIFVLNSKSSTQSVFTFYIVSSSQITCPRFLYIHIFFSIQIIYIQISINLWYRVRGVSVLEFDRVSKDILPRSDSFNDNGFASDKLLWRSEKLLISDEAASSSGDVVICLPFLWRSLRWCRRRRICAGLLHRFVLSFQFCQIDMYESYNLILSYK